MSDRSAEYFQTEAGTPQKAGFFTRPDELPPVSFAPGLMFRPLLGDGLLVNHVYFEPHTEAPTHSHVEEQIVVVLDGELEFWVGDDTRLLRRGDMVVVPAWVPHGARTHDSTCLEIDIFCPPRRQLLEAVRSMAGEASKASATPDQA
jgi:quercetin dioxygenase-like cupin family protein